MPQAPYVHRPDMVTNSSSALHSVLCTFARSSGDVAHWKPLPPCSLARAPTSSACSDTEA